MFVLLQVALKNILGRDSFCATEVDIFNGVRDWAEANDHVDTKTLQEILALIRFPLVPLPVRAYLICAQRLKCNYSFFFPAYVHFEALYTWQYLQPQLS